MDRLVYLASSVFIIVTACLWKLWKYKLTMWFFALFFDSWLSCRRCLRGRRMITILRRQRFFTTRPGHWWYDNYERVYYCDDYDHNFPHHPSFVIIGGAVIWVIRSNDSSQRGDSGDRKQPEVAAQTKMMRGTIKNSNVWITAMKKNPKTLRISGIGLRKAKGGGRGEGSCWWEEATWLSNKS